MFRDPRCNQCMYDMTGIADSWRDSSPIECTCPECGQRQRTRVLFRNVVPPGPIEEAIGGNAVGVFLIALIGVYFITLIAAVL